MAATMLPNKASAQIPRQISYQGLLVDVSGQPIQDGDHVIKASIYDAPSGGTLLYAESISAPTNHGLFNVIIGDNGGISTALNFADQYWMGITVDGGAEMPRTRFTSVPYSLHAEVSDKAMGLSPDATGVVTSINEVDGPLRIIGDSTTRVLQQGRTITISASPQGVTSIQNTDGTITITQPRGPTVTLNITDTSLGDKKFSTGGVLTRALGDGAVTGTKINQMGASLGQVLKWDGTKWKPAMDDTTKIAPGAGIVITQDANGNNVIATTLIGMPPGTQGATFRHDGNAWVSTTSLYNDGNRIGIGTTAPGARLDVNGNILLSNGGGVAPELRFTEPTGNGNVYTSFKARRQVGNIDYTLPGALPIAEAILSTDPNGDLAWKNTLPQSVTVPFDQVTTGTNSGQTLAVGNNSSLKTTGSGIIEANQLRGATIGGNSYAGRLPIPMGSTIFSVTLPTSVGCTPNSSVTVSQMDSQGSNILVGMMVTDIVQNGFTVQFSASYPTTSGFLSYLVVNP